MNDTVRVKVKTPVEISKVEEADGGASQGSVEASTLSSVNLDSGVRDGFEESDKEVKFYNLELAPMIFVDDVLRMGDSIESAQYANELMEELVKRKFLRFNQSKSSFLVMGSRKERKKVENQLSKNPLKLCGKDMEEVKILKYLGDRLSSSLEESVLQTIKQRTGLVKQSIIELRAIIEDHRAGYLGSMNIAFTVFHQSVLPTLFHNVESWIGISNKSLKILLGIYKSFFLTLFRIGSGTPWPNFFWQTGMLLPEDYILQRKLSFVFHLINLPVESLGRQVVTLKIKKNLKEG